MVVEALNGKISLAAHNQVLIDNIFAVSLGFVQASFVFCYREANKVAHRLARWSASSFCNMIWPVGGPTWISDLVDVVPSS